MAARVRPPVRRGSWSSVLPAKGALARSAIDVLAWPRARTATDGRYGVDMRLHIPAEAKDRSGPRGPLLSRAMREGAARRPRTRNFPTRPVKGRAEARHDLAAATALWPKSVAWACFVPQQAAEKAFQAILIAMDGPGACSPGHHRPRRGPPGPVGRSAPRGRAGAAGLDLFYVASRYPDAAPGKRAPFRVITDHQVDDAVRLASGAVICLDGVLSHLKT